VCDRILLIIDNYSAGIYMWAAVRRDASEALDEKNVDCTWSWWSISATGHGIHCCKCIGAGSNGYGCSVAAHAQAPAPAATPLRHTRCRAVDGVGRSVLLRASRAFRVGSARIYAAESTVCISTWSSWYVSAVCGMVAIVLVREMRHRAFVESGRHARRRARSRGDVTWTADRSS